MKYIGLIFPKYNPHYFSALVLHTSNAIMPYRRLSKNINLFRMLHAVNHELWWL